MRRAVAAAFAAFTLLAACSGNKSVSTGRRVAEPTTAPAVSQEVPAEASPGASAAPAAKRAKTSTSRATAKGSVAGTKQTTASGFTYTAADLFTADKDRIGFTDKEIVFCMHAALALGPAFGNSAEDFQVYFQDLNDRGGIYGRKVRAVFTDDLYTPQGGVQAAQQCMQQNPFFIAGGVGFDTVPAVREWAETNKMLYLASFATEKGLYQMRYVFQPLATVEHFGAVAGRYAATKHPGNFGVLWRNSPNWQGGRDGFKAEVEKRGSKVVADIPVQQNQGDYTNAILTLRNADAKTVLAWINVVEFTQLVKQAAAQGYRPRWVNASFNLVTDTLGADVDGTNGPPAIGLWVTPEYHFGDTSVPWAAEERVMEAAMKKYRPNKSQTNDVDWQVWLASKQFAKMLTDCGADCTRNKLAGMMLAGYKMTLPPLCDADFARGKGRLGGFLFNVMVGTKRAGGSSGWKQVETCKEDF